MLYVHIFVQQTHSLSYMRLCVMWRRCWTYVKAWSYKYTIHIRVAYSKILPDIKVMNFADICFSFDLFHIFFFSSSISFFILSLSFRIHSLFFVCYSHFPFSCTVYRCFHNILRDNNCYILSKYTCILCVKGRQRVRGQKKNKTVSKNIENGR